MMQPLTDEELDSIMTAAWALHPSQRTAFEQTVITELQKLPLETRGPGTLHRIIATAQRDITFSQPICTNPLSFCCNRPFAERDRIVSDDAGAERARL